MKIERLLRYISRYTSPEITLHLVSQLDDEYISADDIFEELMNVCSPHTVLRIMRRFVKHELRRGRISKEHAISYLKNGLETELDIKYQSQ